MEKYEEYTAKQYYYEIMRLNEGYSTWVLAYAGDNYCNPKDATNLMKLHNHSMSYALDVILKNLYLEKMTNIQKKIAFSFCVALRNKFQSIYFDYFRDSEEILSEPEERIKTIMKFRNESKSGIEYPAQAERKFGWNS